MADSPDELGIDEPDIDEPGIDEPDINDEWSHRFVRGDGVELHCTELAGQAGQAGLAGLTGEAGEAGERPLMLFLHGFPEFWYSWRHQMRHFADTYHVVAPDLRGYNKSDKPEGRRAYSLDELVADVRELVANLGYDRCILVGHDWGGAVAWQFAHTHPEMLERLIVMNLPHPVRFYEGIRTFAQLRRSWYMFFFQLPWLPETLLGRDHCRTIADLFRAQANNPQAFSDDDLDAYRQAASQPGALTAMLNYYRAIPLEAFSFDTASYDVLEVPTLMVWGEDDTALGKELTYGTERLVRDLQIKYIPNCSHWVQQDRPAIVNRHMRGFLDRTSGSTKS
jgi:pimeloyl-ACP methyl ester carboxylesterase